MRVKKNRIAATCLCVPFWMGGVIAQESETPETGYFKISMTPTDVIGESSAQGLADVLPPDKEINWQLFVPHSYAADNPPGVVVYVSPRETGGPPNAWNDLLGEQNLIWVGANGAGNKNPVAERMLKAIIAPTMLAKTYAINAERCYIAGSVFWGDNTPPKIDLIKQNRHVFMVGTFDEAMKTTRRIYNDYKKAGIENSELIIIRNHPHRLPPMTYFVKAIEYLDSGTIYQGEEQ